VAEKGKTNELSTHQDKGLDKIHREGKKNVRGRKGNLEALGKKGGKRVGRKKGGHVELRLKKGGCPTPKKCGRSAAVEKERCLLPRKREGFPEGKGQKRTRGPGHHLLKKSSFWRRIIGVILAIQKAGTSFEEGGGEKLPSSGEKEKEGAPGLLNETREKDLCGKRKNVSIGPFVHHESLRL